MSDLRLFQFLRSVGLGAVVGQGIVVAVRLLFDIPALDAADAATLTSIGVGLGVLIHVPISLTWEYVLEPMASAVRLRLQMYELHRLGALGEVPADVVEQKARELYGAWVDTMIGRTPPSRRITTPKPPQNIK